jgi:hypothetical protein
MIGNQDHNRRQTALFSHHSHKGAKKACAKSICFVKSMFIVATGKDFRAPCDPQQAAERRSSEQTRGDLDAGLVPSDSHHWRVCFLFPFQYGEQEDCSPGGVIGFRSS